jgi:hypothetical protein
LADAPSVLNHFLGIDRFTSNAYDLVIEGESYRPRLKPSLAPQAQEGARGKQL